MSALILLNPYKPGVFFVRRMQTVQAQTRRKPNAASEQSLHCLLTYCSIKIWIKLKKKSPNNPQNGVRLFQLITVENFHSA